MGERERYEAQRYLAHKNLMDINSAASSIPILRYILGAKRVFTPEEATYVVNHAPHSALPYLSDSNDDQLLDEIGARKKSGGLIAVMQFIEGVQWEPQKTPRAKAA